jgi:DNA processing protein
VRGPHAAVGLPVAAYAAALAGLPGIGPAGLADLLARHGPVTAWNMVLCGEERRPEVREPEGPRQGAPRMPWATAARSMDVAGNWSALAGAGIGVTCLGQPDYPVALRDDPEPPGVLFWRGDLGALERRCVAIVGTRRCTHSGREVAFEMGRALTDAGVCVVSGLALGIDGAAHAGALASRAEGGGGRTVGIAASGVDVPYPRRHAALWSRVIAAGAILSETAPGRQALSWRFPARNRIIAGLARAVVVVESRAGGGSMHTVMAAAARGVDVLVVPGPVHSPASAGTNQLLTEGCPPVRHAGDVLDALGDVRPWPPPARAAPGRRRGQVAPAARDSSPALPGLDAQSQIVLAAVDWTPTPPGVIAERTRLAIGPLSTVLRRLEELALLRDDGGCWTRSVADSRKQKTTKGGRSSSQ